MKPAGQGTPVWVAQPAEEVGSGAQRVLNPGLLKKFPRPDYARRPARAPHLLVVEFRKGGVVKQ